MLARFAIGLALVLSTICFAAAADELNTGDGQPIRNIAVISRLGDTILLYHTQPSVPITVWKGEARPFAMPDFAIDARIERTIGAALTPRFNVVQLADGTAGSRSPIFDEDDIPQFIAALPPRLDIDAYIVLCHDESSVEMGAFLTTHGLVLYRRWHPFDDITALFAFYRMILVDARTGKTIANRVGGIDTSIFEPSTARREIDDKFWPGKDAMPSPEQVPPLRDEFYKFVDESIAWTLKRMKLTS